VVEVLPPASVVGAHRLQVSVGYWADPHVLPRRRDGQLAAALRILLAQSLALLVEVDEALAGPASGPPGIVRRRTPKPRHAAMLGGRLHT
jgi:hypothetical protein